MICPNANDRSAPLFLLAGRLDRELILGREEMGDRLQFTRLLESEAARQPPRAATTARASITPAVIGTMEFLNMVHPQCG